MEPAVRVSPARSPRTASPVSRPLSRRLMEQRKSIGVVLANQDKSALGTSFGSHGEHAAGGDAASVGGLVQSSSGHAVPVSVVKCVELQLSERFGSPQYPAPLDLVRGSQLTDDSRRLSEPQFPSLLDNSDVVVRVASDAEFDVETDPSVDLQVDRVGARRATLAQFNSDSLYSVSFSLTKKRASFIHATEGIGDGETSATRSPEPSHEEYELGRFLPDKDDGPLFPTTSRNPNKALLTIDLQNSAVLVANNVACEMFACTPSDIVGVHFPDLLAHSLDRARQTELIESNIDAEGKVALVKGKVVDVVDRNGSVFPVSLWMKMLCTKPHPRCIAVLEPVERSSALLGLDKEGVIVSADETAKSLFGYEPTELVGRKVTCILPALRLPDANSAANDFAKEFRKQEITGRQKMGQNCPLSVALRPKCEKRGLSSFPHDHQVFQHSSCSLCVIVWSYANLSGLLTVREDGTVHSCNSAFSRRLFGLDESELVGKNMNCVLPELFNLLAMGRSEIGSPDYQFSDDSDGDDVPLPDDVDGGGLSDDEPEVFQLIQRPASSSTPYTLDKVARRVADMRLGSASNEESPIPKTNGEASTSETVGCPRSPIISPLPSNIVQAMHSSSTPQDRKSRSHSSRSAAHVYFSPLASPRPISNKSGPLTASWRSTQQQWAEQVHLDASKILGVSLPTVVRHRDGTSLAALVQVKTVLLDNGQSLFCLWIQRDASMEDDSLCRLDQSYLDISHSLYNMDSLRPAASEHEIPVVKLINPSTSDPVAGDNSDDDSFGESEDDDDDFNGTSMGGGLQRATATVASFGEMLSHSCTLEEEVSQDMFGGEFESNYMTIKSIGKGAFGDVKLAICRSTSQSVVIKFIRKAAVLKESWTETTDEEFNQVALKRSTDVQLHDPDRPRLLPLELILLRRLDHPNIVKAIDVYENDHFFQMVMERHGDGMDLFEFIDYNPQLDEPLASFIFRQIAYAIEYLHSNGIVHRDVKDENVIIDDRFHVKIIDFGSAAYVKPGRLFPTFCGTLEFCSPEVLLGNQYPGPELEMWSLGVTLYTLVFGENPFVEADDILTGHLQPPFSVSPALFKVLLWLLHPDPTSRCTISQLLESSWLKMQVDIDSYRFDDVIGCGNGAAESQKPPGTAVAGAPAGLETSASLHARKDQRQGVHVASNSSV